MKYLNGNDQPVDATKQENLSQRIFEFCLKKEDYFLNYFMNWDRVSGDVYTVRIGDHTFEIGAGLYIFIGTEETSDWCIIEELIGRDIQVFTTTPKLTTWRFENLSLVDVNQPTEYYFPQTRNPMPVVSNDGEKIIMVSVVDQYRSTNNRDHLAMFLI